MAVISTDAGRLLEVLTEHECWQLLSRNTLGRVAYTQHALPAIVPVNYTLSGDDLLLMTDPGSALGRAIDGTVVAFEVDQIDHRTHAGWSVMVVGNASTTDLSQEPPRPSLAGLEPWAAGVRTLLVRIDQVRISGRRLVAPPPVQHRSVLGRLRRSPRGTGITG